MCCESRGYCQNGILFIQTTVNFSLGLFFFTFDFVLKGLLLMSHLLHVSFIAVNVRSNIEPCQHHWYDVYLIQTHTPPRLSVYFR